MNYYIIRPEISDEYIYIQPEDRLFPTDFPDVSMKGEPINKRFIAKFVNRQKDVIKTDFIAGPTMMTPIISSRFKELLETMDNINLEFHKAEIHNSFDKKIDNSYYHLHTLNNIDAFDIENSIFTIMYEDNNGKIKEDILSTEVKNFPDKWSLDECQKIILKDKNVGNRPIFRENRIAAVIIINEELKNKIEEAGLIGISIVPLETYPY